MKITKDSIVGEVVAMDYHAASIFKFHNIDFCCKGGRSIEEVCSTNNIDADVLVGKLSETMQEKAASETDYGSWELDLLADHIEKKHHKYVEQKIPELEAYLNKIAKVHGDRHPELIEIQQLFKASVGELTVHMKKEEFILFPYVKKMMNNPTQEKPPFGTVENPIQMMQNEHDNEGERFRKIAALSNNYTPPADACTTYKVAFAMLKEFEEDLHLHIHLENNILFPKAIEKEKALNEA